MIYDALFPFFNPSQQALAAPRCPQTLTSEASLRQNSALLSSARRATTDLVGLSRAVVTWIKTVTLISLCLVDFGCTFFVWIKDAHHRKIAIFEDIATSLNTGLDVTGDGIPDLLRGDLTETSSAGAAYLVKGPIYPPTPSPSHLPTLAPSKSHSREPTLHPSTGSSES